MSVGIESSLPVVLALTVAVTAGVIDVRTRTIPNALTIPAATAGCALWLLTGGNPTGITACAASSSSTFALCWIVWRVGGWGGGDAKLVTALGCLLPAVTVNGNVVPFAAVFFGWLAVCLVCYHSILGLRKIIPTRRKISIRKTSQGRPLAPVILAALSLLLLLPAPWVQDVLLGFPIRGG
jgi:Flp pilus assembly protein protease CpaA